MGWSLEWSRAFIISCTGLYDPRHKAVLFYEDLLCLLQIGNSKDNLKSFSSQKLIRQSLCYLHSPQPPAESPLPAEPAPPYWLPWWSKIIRKPVWKRCQQLPSATKVYFFFSPLLLNKSMILLKNLQHYFIYLKKQVCVDVYACIYAVHAYRKCSIQKAEFCYSQHSYSSTLWSFSYNSFTLLFKQ